jgi:hypothetical protein
VGKKGGHLWIMPAGRRDAQYQSALASIDWLALYREHDGFLLFEDTKAQWEQEFKPDYVLIDSRTGHTDVEGICTRQLPDAVAMFFGKSGAVLSVVIALAFLHASLSPCV